MIATTAVVSTNLLLNPETAAILFPAFDRTVRFKELQPVSFRCKVYAFVITIRLSDVHPRANNTGIRRVMMQSHARSGRPVCREPSWNENIEVYSDLAINCENFVQGNSHN